MSTSSRRNTIIRAVVTLCGDITVGVAVANACVWLIQSAALGLFLSFLLWLVAVIAALALSQIVVHPTVKLALSDRKLDAGMDVVAGLALLIDAIGIEALTTAVRFAKSSWSRMRPAP